MRERESVCVCGRERKGEMDRKEFFELTGEGNDKERAGVVTRPHRLKFMRVALLFKTSIEV